LCERFVVAGFLHEQGNTVPHLDFADQPPPQLGHHREADKINEGERSIERRRDDRGTTFAVRHRPSDNAVDVLREQVTYLLGVIDADIYE